MPVSIDKKSLSIPESFSGKTILITGGTGFIGKVLIEKLLRSCPDIKNILVLIRPKKNKDIQERVKALFDIPLFDKLKKENIKSIDKVLGINGNVTELNLGLREEDTTTIINTVSIIYHIAACVRFDDFLKSAILSNARSTRDIIFLAKRIKSLDAFMHISTAYCQADRERIDEKAYHPKQNWREAIELAEKYDDETLQVLSQKYIHPMPNTYTFTKALAENVVIELCENQLPFAIIRPAIVTSSVIEPVVGWVDNFNGPSGMNVFGMKGLSRVILGGSDIHQDYLFVDNLVKLMVIATWKKMVEPDPFRPEVYNVSDMKASVTYIMETGKRLAFRNPPETYLMTVKDFILLKNQTVFYLLTFILHILPALILDGVALISGNDPRFMKIYRRAYIANISLSKFMCRNFSIKCENYSTINRSLMESDKPGFGIFCWEDFYSKESYPMGMDIWCGIKQYLLKERAVANEADIIKYSRLDGISNVVIYSLLGFTSYLILSKMVLPWFASIINNIVAV